MNQQEQLEDADLERLGLRITLFLIGFIIGVIASIMFINQVWWQYL